MNTQDSQSELTPDQYLRFKVLVPFHSAMEKKRREDIKLGYMQDASKIYSEAIELIEAYVTTRVKEAERLARVDEADKALFTIGAYRKDEAILWQKKRIEALTTTTNGKD